LPNLYDLTMSRHVPEQGIFRLVSAAVAVCLAVLMAAGCSSQEPTNSYAGQVDEETGLSEVEGNWLRGCEVAVTQSPLAEDANAVCQCSYTALSGVNGIPFDEFIVLDADLRQDPTNLGGESPTSAEAALATIVKGCIASS